MKRPGTASGTSKGHRAIEPNARNAPIADQPAENMQEQLVALTRELKEAREQQTATADVLKVISRSVNNFSGISAELIDELQNTLKGIPLDDKARTEINELTDTSNRPSIDAPQPGPSSSRWLRHLILLSQR